MSSSSIEEDNEKQQETAITKYHPRQGISLHVDVDDWKRPTRDHSPCWDYSDEPPRVNPTFF